MKTLIFASVMLLASGVATAEVVHGDQEVAPKMYWGFIHGVELLCAVDKDNNHRCHTPRELTRLPKIAPFDNES